MGNIITEAFSYMTNFQRLRIKVSHCHTVSFDDTTQCNAGQIFVIHHEKRSCEEIF